MRTATRRTLLEIEQIGDVNVARLTSRHLLDEARIQALGDQLNGLGDEAGHTRLVLNFGSVERVSTEVLGKLMALRRKVQSKGGRLGLCCIQPSIAELFQALKLHSLLQVFPDEQEALQRI